MAENKKLITADNSFLTYMGRIDFSDKTRPEFYYGGYACACESHFYI